MPLDDSHSLNSSSDSQSWRGRRKRIVAREVPAEEIDRVETEMRAAAAGSLQPADVISVPALPGGPPESILDPTLFSERHRRADQNRVYRYTQIAVCLSLLTSCGAILGTLLQHRLRALVIAAFACVFAAVAIKLVRSSRLAHRLRGYVAAACVLALVSAAACYLMPSLHDRSEPDEKKSPAAASQP